MLNFVAWVVVGALLGWLASRGAADEVASGLMLNVLAGVVGAYLAGLLVLPVFARLLGETTVSVPALATAIVGAGGLLVLVNGPRRDRMP